MKYKNFSKRKILNQKIFLSEEVPEGGGGYLKAWSCGLDSATKTENILAITIEKLLHLWSEFNTT